MDIRTLRYFLAVAREGNITRAAESMHITQPSLSKSLMELEQELGKKLLIRGKRKVTLTEEGVLLRKRADEIVNLMEKTEREISSGLKEIKGEIAIGGNPSATVLKSAAELRKAYSGIKFRFYSGDATDVIERLDHGGLDFAVLLKPVDTLKYEYISLPEAAKWGLLMPNDSPLSRKSVIESADLSDIPLVLHQRIGLQREIAIWAKTDLEKLNIAATYNVVQGSPISFVKSGLGYFLTAKDLLPLETGGSVCFRPLEPSLEIQYALVWKRYSVFSKAAQKFIEKIKDGLCL